MPPDTVVRETPDDPVSFTVCRLEQRLKLSIGPHEVGTTVAIDRLAHSTTGDEAAEGGEEGIGGVVANYFQMDCSGTKTYKDR